MSDHQEADLKGSVGHEKTRTNLVVDGHLRVDRPIMTQTLFDITYGMSDESPPRRPQQEIARIVKKKWNRAVTSKKCGSSLIFSFLVSWFPVMQWLPKYEFKKLIISDVVAGVSVGVMNIPEGIAYALLAQVPAVLGLYTSFIPILFYFAMGTSRQCSLGTVAVVSMMTGKIINTYAPLDNMTTITRDDMTCSSPITTETFSAHDMKVIGVAGAAAFLVGIWQLGFGLLRFGALTVYLSDQLVQGFSCAAAFHVFSSQLSAVFGLTNDPETGLPPYNGVFKFIKTWVQFFKVVQNSAGPPMIIASVSIVILVFVKFFINTNKRIKAIIKVPVPAELIVVIIGASVSYAYDLKQYGVKIICKVPRGLPPASLPDFNLMPSLIVDSLSLALVGFAIEVTLAMLFANKHNYAISPNQEFRALGVGNIFGGFFRCFPSGASLARSTVQNDVGGRTQIVSLVQCIIVLVVILELGPLLEPLPKACLGAIIMVALVNLLRQVSQLYYLWKISFIDWTIFFVVFFAVLILDVDYGIAIGMVYAIMTVMFRLQKPKVRSMGLLRETDLYKPLDTYVSASHVRGVRIVRVDAPIYFANAAYIKARLYNLAGLSQVIHELQTKREDTEDEKSTHYAYTNTLVVEEDVGEEIEHKPVAVTTTGRVSNLQQTSSISLSVFNEKNNVIEDDTKDDQPKYLILDCSEVCFVDVTGVAFLKKTATECKNIGVQLLLANTNKSVRDSLELCEAHDYIRMQDIFLSVHDAVLHACLHMGSAKGRMREADFMSHLSQEESTDFTKM